MIIVGFAVPSDSSRDYWILQRRLLPHAQACLIWGEKDGIELDSHVDKGGVLEGQRRVELGYSYVATHFIGALYSD